jgi:two-component system response regulator FixJ
MTIKAVHIVEDDAHVRETLRMLVESAGHEVRAHANAEAFLAALPSEDPGCVVTDVRMPGMDGLELLSRLGRRAPDLPVLVITGHGDVTMAVRALKSGAVDFIEKPFDIDALLGSLSDALERGRLAATRSEARRDAQLRIDRLTEREREVMGLVVDGLSNASVAHRLGISVRTVENHRARVLDKLEARGLSDLVRLQMLADEGVRPLVADDRRASA